MFNDCSIMIIGAKEHVMDIFKLELDADTQAEICRIFSASTNDAYVNKAKIPFDGSYKPHEDEILFIDNFQLRDEIKDAIRNPLGVASYSAENDEFPEIRAVFAGKREEVEENEKFTAVFQKFRKEQYISPAKWFNLFFDNNTFIEEKRFGIGISDNIDCLLDGTELQFSSYFFARQVFDLNDYYRSATDQEVRNFASNDKLDVEDTALFTELANSWIRRKIALINDSRVLEEFSAVKIKTLAKTIGIDISVKNKKIIIPSEKDKLKIILGFLDEEAYRGLFSQVTYLANSKRKV